MKRKIMVLLFASVTASTLLAGCGVSNNVVIKEGHKNPGSTEVTVNQPEPATEVDVNQDDVEITPTENASITWEDYATPDGFITCKIPSGWEVEAHDVTAGDDLSYMVKIYDPSHPERMVFFSPLVTGYQSQEAVEIAKNYDYTGLVDWSIMPINSECTTSSLFANSGQFWGYSDFTEVANLGENGWGGDVLQATCTYNGMACEGVFTSATTLPLGNSMSYFGTNISPVSEYGTTIMMASAEDFPNWEPILTDVFNSIVMTDTYQQARAIAWKKVIGTSEQLAAVANYTSDLIMSGWESRNSTYDILSQQTSDATMGRDRVYDTETGEVYYTDLGWYDSYDGTRFEYIGEGSSYYNLPVTGTIE